MVQDNGQGIPEDSLGHLTEAFYRVDKSRSRAQGGSGLGLALCENIVRLHGGELRFQSMPGQGTDVVAEFRGGRALAKGKWKRHPAAGLGGFGLELLCCSAWG